MVFCFVQVFLRSNPLKKSRLTIKPLYPVCPASHRGAQCVGPRLLANPALPRCLTEWYGGSFDEAGIVERRIGGGDILDDYRMPPVSPKEFDADASDAFGNGHAADGSGFMRRRPARRHYLPSGAQRRFGAVGIKQEIQTISDSAYKNVGTFKCLDCAAFANIDSNCKTSCFSDLRQPQSIIATIPEDCDILWVEVECLLKIVAFLYMVPPTCNNY